jgi:HEAT repeat protein
VCFSFTSFLTAKQVEFKKEGLVQKDEMKQAQGANPNESKQGGKEGPSKEPSSLTEEEQRELEKSAGPGWQGPGVFKTKEEAVKYLKILVKGDEKTIRYFQQAEKGYRKHAYDTHLAIALSAIDAGKSREAFNLTVEVLKTKRDYPEALAEAAQAVKHAHDASVIPLLREIVKSPNPSVRLQAAGSLLSLGDGDTALPVLDELVEKEGSTAALSYLFREPEKIIDERGFKILEKALSNPNAEVRIRAVDLLWISKKIEKREAEQIAFEILEKLKNKIEKDYGIGRKQMPGKTYDETYVLPGREGETLRELEKPYYSDRRACDRAMWMLGEVKSQRAIPLLENIMEGHQSVGWVCSEGRANRTAERALRKITGGGGKK